MKFRNKKTGEVKDWDFVSYFNTVCGKTYGQWECGLAEFIENAEKFRDDWEDYKEPKEYWFIDIRYPKVEPKKDINLSNSMRKRLKEIGNYFETKEEAEKVVEKLKAWKRLKDARFAFGLPEYTLNEDSSIIGATGSVGFSCLCYEDFEKDLDLLFGGGE